MGAAFLTEEVSVARGTSGFSVFAVALGAAAVGAFVGVLFAPESGEQTRRKLGSRIEKEADALKKKGRRALQDFGEMASERFEDGKERLSELLHS